MKFSRIIGSRVGSDDGDWISVSDLMAGLMIIFLFVAITYIRPIVETQNKIKEIVVTWNASEVDIKQALEDEFAKDLAKWNAEFDQQTLTIRFKAPEVLFEAAEATLKSDFKAILDDFFPRYVAVLHNFRFAIAEVRIEGHTSSEWSEGTSDDEAYFKNMGLSQDRTRSVLEYGLSRDMPNDHKDFVRELITANGLSSSQVILKNGVEDREASRRVEFRVRTNVKEQIIKVLETVG